MRGGCSSCGASSEISKSPSSLSPRCNGMAAGTQTGRAASLIACIGQKSRFLKKTDALQGDTVRPTLPVQESHRLRNAIRFSPIASALAFTLTCFVLSLPRNASAQASAGITGTVTDSTGAVVANAHVDIVNDGTTASDHAVTNGAGTYSFKGLLPGTYSVPVDAAGFKKAVQKGVLIEVSTNRTVDISLATGTTNETVQVV